MPEIYATPAQVASEVKPLKTAALAGVSDAAFQEQTDRMTALLHALADAEAGSEGSVVPTSWAQVQDIVRAGLADRFFSIGDQLICQRGGANLVWDVIGIDHDTPADPQFTHSMTLQLHDCFPTTMQFDAPEALYYCETALAADDIYHFAVSGTDYQFTVPSGGIAAGSQLMLNFTGDTPVSLSVSAAKGGTASGSITVTAGDGGTALVTNDVNRVIYGSNNYRESAIRQWMNSSAAAGSVWTPQNNYDRPPEWAANTEGFLYGMDADFLAVVGSVTKSTAIPGSDTPDTTVETFFLLSRSEVYGGVEVNGVNEGASYPYYADYSSLEEAENRTNPDSSRIRYRSDTAQIWWTRTPNAVNGNSVRCVTAQGAVSHSNARLGTNGVAPACNII